MPLLQKEKQELEAHPILLTCGWLDAVSSVGSTVPLQTA